MNLLPLDRRSITEYRFVVDDEDYLSLSIAYISIYSDCRIGQFSSANFIKLWVVTVSNGGHVGGFWRSRWRCRMSVWPLTRQIGKYPSIIINDKLTCSVKDNIVSATSTSYKMKTYSSPTIFKAVMANLVPGNKAYFYRVGSPSSGYSEIFSFKSNPGSGQL